MTETPEDSRHPAMQVEAKNLPKTLDELPDSELIFLAALASVSEDTTLLEVATKIGSGAMIRLMHMLGGKRITIPKLSLLDETGKAVDATLAVHHDGVSIPEASRRYGVKKKVIKEGVAALRKHRTDKRAARTKIRLRDAQKRSRAQMRRG